MHTKQVILIAHGSRNSQWQTQFQHIESLIQDYCLSAKPKVAFMELAEPTLAQQVQSSMDEGIKHFVVVPLFFAEGKHLKVDIPNQINELLQQHPIHIELTPAIGLEALLQQSIAAIADQYQNA